jgi:mxaA protein
MVRTCAMAAFSMAALAVQSAPSTGAAAVNAVVEQPRPFGYVVGDLLTQRVLLQSEGHEFQPAALPRTERVGVWLERRAVKTEVNADGRRWLAVDYQLINAPQALTTISLPAWELKPKSGATALRIGEWPISVTALSPRIAFAKGGLTELRPDRPASLIATEPFQRGIRIWSAAFILTLASWLGWLLWRDWRAVRKQPFARALREIRRVDAAEPEAWQALHRAFDRTAGQVTQTATLPALFQRAPHLQSLRPQIEQFFEQSSELFFGKGLSARPVSVLALCAELRRIEKRHER